MALCRAPFPPSAGGTCCSVPRHLRRLASPRPPAASRRHPPTSTTWCRSSTSPAATARPGLRPALTTVAAERSDHAQALSDEIARLTGEAATSTTTTTTTSTAQATAPAAKDVVDALRKSADSAGQLASQMSGYRAGLLGSIAASCTAAYAVALAPQRGEAP